jgi:aerobic C4-dicarboxylate transport protein
LTKPIYRNMTVQVLTAIAIGLLIGYVKPKWGVALEPLKEGFIRLVTMVVGPIIFLTIVVGIASMGDLKKVGRVGFKALVYFEVMTTIALAIGMLVANAVQPGKDIYLRSLAAAQPAGSAASTLPTSAPAPTTQTALTTTAAEQEVIQKAAEAAKKQSVTEFLLNIIPKNIVNAFATGDLLQILFFSVIFGIAVASLGHKSSGLMVELEHLTEVMFRIVGLVMKLAPLGAMGAMAWVIGKYGLGSLVSLGQLMLCVYLTMAVFVFLVLGLTCRIAGFSLWRFLVYIKEEILLDLGTSTTESALPRLI